MNYWLLKSEPDVYGFANLCAQAEQTDSWDGIRNYQARNFMRDEMKLGDRVLFYHSSCPVPAVVGVAEVVREAYPDPTQFDPDGPYFDPKASPAKPRWVAVDIKAMEALARPVTLKELKATEALSEMRLVQRGNRLSVMPVTASEYQRIITMGS